MQSRRPQPIEICAVILRAQNDFIAVGMDGNSVIPDLRRSRQFSQLAPMPTLGRANSLRGHRPKRLSLVIGLSQEQRAYDSVMAGDDVDMPYAGRRALNLGQWAQPDHSAFAFVAGGPGQLRGDNDISSASDRVRQRLIIGPRGRLAVKNIERNRLWSRRADSFQTTRHQRARPRKAPKAGNTRLINRNDDDLGRRSDLPPAAQQPVTSRQIQLRNSP